MTRHTHSHPAYSCFKLSLSDVLVQEVLPLDTKALLLTQSICLAQLPAQPHECQAQGWDTVERELVSEGGKKREAGASWGRIDSYGRPHEDQGQDWHPVGVISACKAAFSSCTFFRSPPSPSPFCSSPPFQCADVTSVAAMYGRP